MAGNKWARPPKVSSTSKSEVEHTFGGRAHLYPSIHLSIVGTLWMDGPRAKSDLDLGRSSSKVTSTARPPWPRSDCYLSGKLPGPIFLACIAYPFCFYDSSIPLGVYKPYLHSRTSWFWLFPSCSAEIRTTNLPIPVKIREFCALVLLNMRIPFASIHYYFITFVIVGMFLTDQSSL